MNIAEILIWESTNALLLIPVVIGIVMLTRWIRGRPVFTQRDWLFLFGHPQEKVLSLHLWLRFAALWFAVVLIGFVEGCSVTLWSTIVRRYSVAHRFCSLACCTEVATLNADTCQPTYLIFWGSYEDKLHRRVHICTAQV
jgi:hypothetical protein